MSMEGPRTQPAQQKKPASALEKIKKAVRILAVGSTLAGGMSTEVNVIKPQDKGPETHNTAITDDPEYVMSDKYKKWRQSTNIEDDREFDVSTPAKQDGHATAAFEPPDQEEPIVPMSLEAQNKFGLHYKDIDNAAKRIEAEVKAKKAAEAASLKAKNDAWLKKRAERLKKEEAKGAKVIVGAPKR